MAEKNDNGFNDSGFFGEVPAVLSGSTRIVQMIYTTDMRGTGSLDSPIRRVQQLFTLTGILIAEYDPCGVRDADNKFSAGTYLREMPF